MKNKICSKNKCTGCGSCVNICPYNCIRLIQDDEGFFSPEIDYDKCRNCNLCEKKCPSNAEYKTNNSKPKVFAAFYKEKQKLMKSTSGGVFQVLADYIISKNGKVYGASMNNNLNVFHSSANTISEYQKMLGSKYIQSNTKYTFQEVKKDLEDNKFVLFSGTPCQIAGLYAFLNNKKYSRLLTVDLVCHGVASTKLFKTYIEYIERKYKQKVTYVNFRSKVNGYNLFTIELTFDTGKKIYKKSKNDIFMSMYFRKGIYRESCYNCKYASIPRIADITLGDFWGVKKEHPNMYNEYGVSAIIINTNIGLEIFSKIKDSITFEECKLENILEYNKSLSKSSEMPKNREQFFNEIDSYSIKELLGKYVPRNSIIKIIKNYVIIIVKKVLRKK